MLTPDDDEQFSNELNEFYARFDVRNESEELESILRELRAKDCTCPSVSETDVRKQLCKQKVRKAPGPDGISGKVLKECSQQLAGILTILFNKSLSIGYVPSPWKESTLVPLPKSYIPEVKNDLRPVALTALIMKNFEKLFAGILGPEVDFIRDILQFAYKQKSGVEDAVLTLLNCVHKHLDQPHSAVRTLFIDFSSAFNTISPLLLVKKLTQAGVNPRLITWIASFLTNRTQRVRFGSKMSKPITTNLGAPQGCVLSPILFTLYTSDCRSPDTKCKILKYADDTVIIGNIDKQKDCKFYFDTVKYFVDWCQVNCLHLNVKKTKEIIFDFGKNAFHHDSVNINGADVDKVEEYKYLGCIIDDKLNWSKNTELICSKANKRMYFLRKLKEFRVDNTILRLFYQSVIQSILKFCMVCWFSSLSVKQVNSLERIIRTANRIISDGLGQHMDELFNNDLICMYHRIVDNKDHPLVDNFEILRSGTRLRATKVRTNRFKMSFIPQCVMKINELEVNDRAICINKLTTVE
jgi:hypothetical protein